VGVIGGSLQEDRASGFNKPNDRLDLAIAPPLLSDDEVRFSKLL
jgi:hypothetical protein